MAESRKIVRVFLASPGDLIDERKATKGVVDEFNSLYADAFGYQVELVGWEDTVSAFGRPQELINRDLERCEFFIGLMWKKWGTPPDTTGKYTSGFEEEFEISVARRIKNGNPEISVYFKEIDSEFLVDPGDDLKKVLAFKQKLIDEKRIYFEKFSDINSLESKIRKCISNYVFQLRARELSAASLSNQTPTQGGEKPPAAISVSTKKVNPLSEEGAKFLTNLLLKFESIKSPSEIQALEVARFRLLSGLVGRQGNDDRSLGVHDANVIFSEGRTLDFGETEITGLVTAGLRNYGNENVPLWWWLAKSDGLGKNVLPVYTIAGSDHKRRTGALLAMTTIGESIKDSQRKEITQYWFSEKIPQESRIAALEYLRDWGLEIDLRLIQKEFDRNDNQTVAVAAEAIVSISARKSRQSGIDALYQLQPNYVKADVARRLFSEDSAVSNEVLLGGVGHRSVTVRRAVVGKLRERKALAAEICTKLLRDEDEVVRLNALLAQVESGQVISDVTAKEVLAPSGIAGGLRTGALTLGAFGLGAVDYFAQFRFARLATLKDKELTESLGQDSTFNHDVEFAIAERHFGKYGERLRRDVNDFYESRFSADIEKLAATLGSTGSDTVEKARGLSEYTRKNLTRQGLDIICRQLDSADLTLVRRVVKSGFVDFSEADILYLEKYGEWRDIDLIVESVERPSANRRAASLLTDAGTAKYPVAARAILRIGRKQLVKLFDIQMPSRLRAHLIALMPKKEFRRLNLELVTNFLKDESDNLRKATALKCVASYPRTRIVKLIQSYSASGESFYYNAIHWLDFGVSVPRPRAVKGAGRLLDKQWSNRISG